LKARRFAACTALALAACGGSNDGGTNHAAGGAARSAAEQDCAAAESASGVKARLFEKAEAAAGAKAASVRALAGGTVARIEQPVVEQREEAARRTVCAGRIVLDLPPGTAGGPAVAQIRYSVQMAADGSGRVYEVYGAEPLFARLAGGAVPAAPAAAGPAAAATATATAKPSFACGPGNSKVEATICGSRTLADMDRDLAQSYRRALELGGEPGFREAQQEAQRQFLRDRNACQSATCIAGAYRERLGALKALWEENGD
jgi:hypothetical protein